MHGHWFISMGHQEHAFLGSAFNDYISSKYLSNWFTYIFVNVCSMPKWLNVQDGMQLRPSDIVVSPNILRLF